MPALDIVNARPELRQQMVAQATQKALTDIGFVLRRERFVQQVKGPGRRNGPHGLIQRLSHHPTLAGMRTMHRVIRIIAGVGHQHINGMLAKHLVAGHDPDKRR